MGSAIDRASHFLHLGKLEAGYIFIVPNQATLSPIPTVVTKSHTCNVYVLGDSICRLFVDIHTTVRIPTSTLTLEVFSDTRQHIYFITPVLDLKKS